MSLSAFEDEDEEIDVQKTESTGNGQGEEKREQWFFELGFFTAKC